MEKPQLSALCTAGMLCSLALASSAQLEITAGRKLDVGPNPRWTVGGDWNGDGIPDLVVSGKELDPGISADPRILIGIGAGEFLPPLTLPTHTIGGDSIVAEDFNGDGFLDLAVAYSGDIVATENKVGLLLGQGDGTFVLGTLVDLDVLAPQPLLYPVDLVADDMNGDGNLDLFALSVFGSQVESPLGYDLVVLFGDGAAGLSSGTPNRVHNASGISAAVGDWNGDDMPDVAVARRNGGLSDVHLGDGTGAFTPIGDLIKILRAFQTVLMLEQAF